MLSWIMTPCLENYRQNLVPLKHFQRSFRVFRKQIEHLLLFETFINYKKNNNTADIKK